VKTGDHLSPMDRAIVGSPRMQLRFDIPDQISARDVVIILRTFCNRLEVLSDTRKYSEREALLMMKFERHATQARLMSKWKRKKE